MKREIVLSALAALLLSGAAQADYSGRQIGSWVTKAREDRFGDGGSYIALTTSGGAALGVRCIGKTLSLAMMELGDYARPINEGDRFEFKFRVDKGEVVALSGVAIGGRLIQIAAPRSLVRAMREGKETAMRVETADGVSAVVVFQMLGAPKAFADLARECGLD
ncbi:hypothetical protein RPPS3_25340 [Rhodopseudomonas palustris]|uniref:hypothetical protein n=1 Tax=Rhodopseudomonas palustris TaxID=1076 RepID=UPI000D1AAE53|nr:hypothetical protein [Rhodopseudomonas palustris]AVT76597.1 hypothetical protein RPPS3_25340 [Rhodopseudomonas palustris]